MKQGKPEGKENVGLLISFPARKNPWANNLAFLCPGTQSSINKGMFLANRHG